MTQESNYDFLAKIQRKKMQIAESIEKKEGACPKKVEVDHDIEQASPQKGSPMPSPKKKKAKPAPALKEPKSAEDTMEHPKGGALYGNGKKSKSEDVNESLFVLAGIEKILTSEDKKQGAIGAIDIIKNYMGGNIDPQYQEFIDRFAEILKRNTKAPVDRDASTKK